MATKAQKTEFRRVLKQLRTQAGLSQREVAERIGKTSASIAQWESGYYLPKEDRIADLEMALDVEPNTLGKLLGITATVPNSKGQFTGVIEAVDADEQLSDADKDLVVSIYERLISEAVK